MIRGSRLDHTLAGAPHAAGANRARPVAIAAWVVVAIAVVVAAHAATAADPVRDPVPRSAEFLARVDAAVARGVAWLRKAQAADGSFEAFPNYPGATTALAYQTLRVCGVARDDRAATRAWSAMRAAGRRADLQTYSAASLLLAVAEQGDRDPAAKDGADVRLAPDTRRWATEIAQALVAGQRPDGCWGYGLPGTGGPGSAVQPGGMADMDHSNTQYALLGLHAAARCGIAIDAAVWTRSLRHWIGSQQKSGNAVAREGPPPTDVRDPGRTSARTFDHARGWDYRGEPDPQAYAAMTAGGVASVVLCRNALRGARGTPVELALSADRAAWDGLAWLGRRWPGPPIPDDLPPSARAQVLRGFADRLDPYEYYAVERAGVLAGVTRMAGVDWYGAGAEPLLAAQAADGSWLGVRAFAVGVPGAADAEPGQDGVRRMIDTCFALLFLKRGTPAPPQGLDPGAVDRQAIDFAALGRLRGRDFDDGVALVLQRWTASQDDGEKLRLFDAATALGPRVVPPLLAALDADDAPRRAAANALLRRATGLDFEFDPAGAAAARSEAVARWRSWWDAKGHRVSYDPEEERLVVR